MPIRTRSAMGTYGSTSCSSHPWAYSVVGGPGALVVTVAIWRWGHTNGQHGTLCGSNRAKQS